MTKKDALTIAINAINYSLDELRGNDNSEYAISLNNAYTTIQAMIAQLEKPRKVSDEAKAKASAKRKAETAAMRAVVVATVAPVLRKYLTITGEITAKGLFAAAEDELPQGFTAPQVQNILLREMAPELIKTETKGKPNTYRLAN